MNQLISMWDLHFYITQPTNCLHPQSNYEII